MLDEFLQGLSDEAQLKIALRLLHLALPVWNTHLEKQPADLKKINALIEAEGSETKNIRLIDAELPGRYLRKIEESFERAQATGNAPVPLMKSDVLLAPLFRKIMQPLTSTQWDDILPYSVRLVYTSVWNVLTWLLYRRLSYSGETHICVAVNQAADALMTEKLQSVDEINQLLNEYSGFHRSPGEDAAWDNAPGALGEAPGLNPSEIYARIAGEKIIKDPPSAAQIAEILRQMRDEGRSYWDQWDEYYSGTCKTYSYNAEKQSYWLTEADVIVASFFNQYPLSEKQMADFIGGRSLYDLRQSGFEI